MRPFLVLLALSIALFAEEVKLENLRFVDSVYGLPKKEASVVPGERLVLLFDAKGMKREGVWVAFKLGTDLLDSTGQSVLSWEGDETRVADLFGGASHSDAVCINFADTVPLGSYKMKVTFEDTKSRETASALLPIAVIAPRLSIINAGLSSDADGVQSHGRSLVEQEAVHVVFGVAGLKVADGKAKLQEDLQILDESGASIGWQPNAVDAEIPMQRAVASVFNRLVMTRAGKYTVKIVVRDMNADGAKAEYAFPIEVVAPPR